MFYGLDVHRSFTQVCRIDGKGRDRCDFRIDADHDAIVGFAQSLTDDDAVVLEATFHSWTIGSLLQGHGAKVVVANALQVKAIAHARIETDKVRRWVAFLCNHKEAIATMDFFTVPTLSLRVMYGFFVIEHGRWHILHFNATFNPTAAWVVQQLREAFPYDSAPNHLLFDGDAIFGPAMVRFVKEMGIKPRRIAYRSPWQNPVAEHWIDSCRRELLDHVVVMDDRHLRRLILSYLPYYHGDCPHLGLEKDAPHGRVVTPSPAANAKVISLPRVGGLHRRYEWSEAA